MGHYEVLFTVMVILGHFMDIICAKSVTLMNFAQLFQLGCAWIVCLEQQNWIFLFVLFTHSVCLKI